MPSEEERTKPYAVREEAFDELQSKLIEKVKKMQRENHIILLTEFVEYLDNQRGNRTVLYGQQGKNNALKSIERFLNERNK
jgi:hypothetical protein